MTTEQLQALGMNVERNDKGIYRITGRGVDITTADLRFVEPHEVASPFSCLSKIKRVGAGQKHGGQ